MSAILNPKRPRKAKGRERWYPYYAGFSEEFARSLIKAANLRPLSRVLDPWNGGGTTTAAAAQSGVSAIGCDINPVSVILSRARLLSTGELLSLKPLSKALTGYAVESCSWHNDPLLTWFSEAGAMSFRSLELSIRNFLLPSPPPLTRNLKASEISNLAAFYYLALFRTARKMLTPLKMSNPTWIKRGKFSNVKIDVSRKDVFSAFHAFVDELSTDLEEEKNDLSASTAPCEILLASSQDLPVATASIDLAISSPPYCTRIDYGVATLPELAVLGMNTGNDLRELREALIGTPTVSKSANIAPEASWGQSCVTFLDQISDHSSRASRSYYLKTHLQYYAGIARSIDELSRCLKDKAQCVLVVQDSYYKELYNDLPTMLTEMASNRKLSLSLRKDFPVARSMAGINPGVRVYRSQATATESVLCFTKVGE